MTEEQIDQRVWVVNLLIAVLIGFMSGLVFGTWLGMALLPNLLVTFALMVLYNIVVSGRLNERLRMHLRGNR